MSNITTIIKKGDISLQMKKDNIVLEVKKCNIIIALSTTSNDSFPYVFPYPLS